MIRQPIAETTLAGLRPTGVSGTRVLENWEQIDHFLRNDLGADIANLFAEPVFQSGKVIWFGPEGTPVIPFGDLPADQQDALRARLSEALTRLAGTVDRLRRAPDANARLIGEVLERAQQVPPPVADSLISVAGRPVLINWSLEPEGDPSPFQPLMEFVRPSAVAPSVRVPPPLPPAIADTDLPPAPPPPIVTSTVLAAARQPPWWWLLWLLALGLLAAIYYLLLSGCGLRLGGLDLSYCPAAATTPDTDREDALLAELAQLQQQLDQAPRCDAPLPPPNPQPGLSSPQPAPATSAENQEFENRMNQRDAQEGDLTITLIWDSQSDLDLFVTCPSGDTIGVGNRNPAGCNGRLDVDANVGNTIVPNPVENIFFPTGHVVPGTYRVIVRNYESRIQKPDNFQVRVKKGQDISIYNGTVGNKKEVRIIDVTFP